MVYYAITNTFVFFVLFFPVNLYYVYHFIILIPLIVLFFIKKATLNTPVRLMLLFLGYWIVGDAIRLFCMGDNVRDFFEIFRFIPVLIFLLYKDFLKPQNDTLIHIVCVYVLFNFFISLIQFLFKDSSLLVHVIGSIYNSNIHFNESLLQNSRALGLSMGPNSNAIMVLLCIVFLWFKFKPKKTLAKLLKISSVLAGILTILLTQSQTGFITLAVLIFYIFILNLMRKPILTLSFAFIFVVPFSLYFFNTSLISELGQKKGEFYYLSTLFEQGTERGSYQLRVEKRNEMIEKALSNPGYSLIGWGKDYFGDDTSATDNEHLYIALVYGPLIWLAFVLVCFYYGAKYTLLYLKSGISNHLFIPVISLCWVVFAIPASFITYPASFVLSILFLNYEDEQ